MTTERRYPDKRLAREYEREYGCTFARLKKKETPRFAVLVISRDKILDSFRRIPGGKGLNDKFRDVAFLRIFLIFALHSLRLSVSLFSLIFITLFFTNGSARVIGNSATLRSMVIAY